MPHAINTVSTNCPASRRSSRCARRSAAAGSFRRNMFTSAINIAHAAAPTRAIAAALCLGILGLTGYHRAPPAENAKGGDAAQPAPKEETQNEGTRGAEGVTLTAEQAEKLGVAT